MYYKRLFTGNSGQSSFSTLKYMGLDGNPSSTNFKTNFRAPECKIVGQAIAQTLKDCGLTDAYYDENTSFLYFRHGKDMSGFQIYNNGNSGIYFNVIKNYRDMYFSNPNNPSMSATGTGWGTYGNTYIDATHIFGGSITDASQAYRFKVIVKGDTKTFFRLMLSSYSDDNAEHSIAGIGFFNYGEQVYGIVGYQMLEANYNTFPYWILMKASNLEFLGDGDTHANTYNTNAMTRPLDSFTYYPTSGNGSTVTIHSKNLTLSPIIFRYAGGVNNPKIYLAPRGYVNGTDISMTTNYSRFFQSGGKRFYQESSICVEA